MILGKNECIHKQQISWSVEIFLAISKLGLRRKPNISFQKISECDKEAEVNIPKAYIEKIIKSIDTKEKLQTYRQTWTQHKRDVIIK